MQGSARAVRGALSRQIPRLCRVRDAAIPRPLRPLGKVGAATTQPGAAVGGDILAIADGLSVDLANAIHREGAGRGAFVTQRYVPDPAAEIRALHGHAVPAGNAFCLAFACRVDAREQRIERGFAGIAGPGRGAVRRIEPLERGLAANQGLVLSCARRQVCGVLAAVIGAGADVVALRRVAFAPFFARSRDLLGVGGDGGTPAVLWLRRDVIAGR